MIKLKCVLFAILCSYASVVYAQVNNIDKPEELNLLYMDFFGSVITFSSLESDLPGYGADGPFGYDYPGLWFWRNNFRSAPESCLIDGDQHRSLLCERFNANPSPDELVKIQQIIKSIRYLLTIKRGYARGLRSVINRPFFVMIDEAHPNNLVRHQLLSAIFTLTIHTWDRIWIMDALIEQGADVNARDDNGDSPLFFAMRALQFFENENIHILAHIKRLLQAGASPDLANAAGETPQSLISQLPERLHGVLNPLFAQARIDQAAEAHQREVEAGQRQVEAGRKFDEEYGHFFDDMPPLSLNGTMAENLGPHDEEDRQRLGEIEQENVQNSAISNIQFFKIENLASSR